MSDKFIKKIMKAINKYNYVVDRYKKFGKTPEIPYRAFVNYADTLMKIGFSEMAEEYLRNASNFAFPCSDALINLGLIRQSANEHKKAIEYFKKAFKKDSKNLRALCLWGYSLSFLDDLEGAYKKYQQAIDIDNKCAEAYAYWGITLIGEQKYKEAREKLELAIEYNPKDVKALFLLASVEIELAFYDDALMKLIFIINVTENNYAAYHNIAYIYFKKKDYEKTIEYAQRTIGMAPFKVEAYLLLGDTYLLMKKYKEAIGIYECAEKNNIQSLFLYISWGSVFQMKRKYNEAIEKYLKGLELCPTQVNDEIYSRLARCYYETKNIEEAKHYAIKTQELNKDNYTSHEVLGDIAFVEQDCDKAIEEYSFCLSNSKSKAITYYKLARCYLLKEDFELANKNYEKSLEYDRDNKNILQEYVHALTIQGKYDEASKKLPALEKMSEDDLDVLLLSFRVHYNIAKGNVYGYNGMKAIKVADKIRQKYPESFCFEDEYRELTNNSRE